jgi:hypothetical protein
VNDVLSHLHAVISYGFLDLIGLLAIRTSVFAGPGSRELSVITRRRSPSTELPDYSNTCKTGFVDPSPSDSHIEQTSVTNVPQRQRRRHQ